MESKIKPLWVVALTISTLTACSTVSEFKSLIEASICTENYDGYTGTEYGVFNIENPTSNTPSIGMKGIISQCSLTDFNALHAKYPAATLINMYDVEGSIDDETNLKVAQKVHNLGMDIRLVKDSEIASGGVDFFLAGTTRTKGDNSKIGVHSWADGSGKTATDYPKGHAYHLPYINFYTAIGMTQQQAEDFYYFTINSASADSIHWMTEAEIAKYNILTSGNTTTASNNGIETSLPSGLDSVYSTANNFNRYTKVTAPNGKSIHILAQDLLNDEQIIRARSVLEFYLTNYEGSLYGSDKSAVANKMADNGATLALLNSADVENPIGEQVTGQPPSPLF